MSASYFNHEFVSNSDLKRVVNKYVKGIDEPENLEDIFKLGTLIHAILLEPHLADKTHPQYELAKAMAATIFKDPLCRNFLLIRDFKREREFYTDTCNPAFEVQYGLKGRIKVDGDSELMSTVMEYKGLAVTTEKAFLEAIDRFDYDQGAAYYLEVCQRKRILIPAPSKKDPKKLFKILVDRDHPIYKRGLEKMNYAIQVWKDFFPKEVEL
jgi:hypothetical protein